MGYVYVMKAGDACKIGITNRDVNKRASQIQTGCPLRIEKIWSSGKIENERDIERILHDKFSDKKTSGEWFAESYDLIVRTAIATIRNSRKKETHKKDCSPAKKIVPIVKPYLTIRQAARYSGISEYFIRNGAKNGLIPHIMCGNRYMINYEKFLSMMEEMAGG